jgi:hypothetical protein
MLAGFNLNLSDDGLFLVSPASRLTDEQRQFIRAHRDEIAAYLAHHKAESYSQTPPPPEPALTHEQWVTLAKAYQAHHVTCNVCIAAGKGYGLRCGAGAALWSEYDRAPAPPRTRPARTGGAK